jgi:hypothetical protein
VSSIFHGRTCEDLEWRSRFGGHGDEEREEIGLGMS